MHRDADVLIVGGGLVGPALAIALASGGLSSIVLDARPPEVADAETFDGRAYALALATRRMLVALGLWGQLSAQTQPILEIKVSDGRPGEGASPLFLHFDYREIEEGPMGHMVENRWLRRALTDEMDRSESISHRPGTGVVAQSADSRGVEVTLADGARLRAGLLAGCDGRDSAVASRAGIRRLGWEYRQTSLVAAVEHELPHRGIAHQLFLPAGPLAILPLPGNRSSIVWTEARDRAAAIEKLDKAGYLEALRPRFGDFLGDIRLAGARFTYPLGLSLAERFVGPRLALAGDAAHGIHPLAGQGLNLGLRDAAALAETLVAAHRRGEDPGAVDVLARYQRWRRFDTGLLAAATDGLNRVFSNDNPALRLLRDFGLGLVDRAPALRRGLIRQAAGLSGDVPRLLRGEAL